MGIVVLPTFIFGEGVGFPGTLVINSCELPRGGVGIKCWSSGKAAKALTG